VDQRHRRARKGGDGERARERRVARDVEPLDGPEAHHGADEHHPLDAEVQNA